MPAAKGKQVLFYSQAVPKTHRSVIHHVRGPRSRRPRIQAKEIPGGRKSARPPDGMESFHVRGIISGKLDKIGGPANLES